MKRLWAICGYTFLAVAVVIAFSMISGSAQAASAPGSSTFDAKCAVCHGKDGKGQTVMGKKAGLKDLGSADVQKMSDEELTKIITDGKGKMPAYKGKLSDQEIKDLVSYIRTFKK